MYGTSVRKLKRLSRVHGKPMLIPSLNSNNSSGWRLVRATKLVFGMTCALIESLKTNSSLFCVIYFQLSGWLSSRFAQIKGAFNELRFTLKEINKRSEDVRN